jgi:hypothetical protein
MLGRRYWILVGKNWDLVIKMEDPTIQWNNPGEIIGDPLTCERQTKTCARSSLQGRRERLPSWKQITQQHRASLLRVLRWFRFFFKHTPALTTKKYLTKALTYEWKNIAHKEDT